MFRQAIRVRPGEFVADLVGNSAGELPVGKIPIGTCDNICDDDPPRANEHLHPVGFLGERLDDQLLILLSPIAHPRVRAHR